MTYNYLEKKSNGKKLWSSASLQHTRSIHSLDTVKSGFVDQVHFINEKYLKIM